MPKTRTWDTESGHYDLSEPGRHADAYVFALFTQREAPIDPLDLDQWKFYALSTTKIDDRKSIIVVRSWKNPLRPYVYGANLPTR